MQFGIAGSVVTNSISSGDAGNFKIESFALSNSPDGDSVTSYAIGLAENVSGVYFVEEGSMDYTNPVDVSSLSAYA